MKANTLFGLFNWAIAYSTRWLGLMIQTETPSRRFVRKLSQARLQSTRGVEELRGNKTMGRILDPDWKQFVYVPAAKTDLRISMEKYKERVFGENQGVYSGPKTPSHSQGDYGAISGQQVNGLPGAQIIGLRKKT